MNATFWFNELENSHSTLQGFHLERFCHKITPIVTLASFLRIASMWYELTKMLSKQKWHICMTT
jgi:hypothetical protein